MYPKIKNFLKKNLILIVLILYGSFVLADSMDAVSDIGTITLNLINRPPVITDIYFNHETAFEDDKLGCIVIVNDEKPDETILLYKWYINNELIEANDNYLAGFNENDLVRCEVTPTDNENVVGETKNITLTINKKPFLSAITGLVIENINLDFLFSLTFFFGVL